MPPVLDENGNEIPAVTFNEKQQEKVNQLIREKQGEAARAVREQNVALEAEKATLAADLAAARADLAKAKTPATKAAAKDEIEALQTQMAEMKAANTGSLQELERANRVAEAAKKEATEAKSETLKVRKEVAIQRAASKLAFVDLGMVTKLTEDSIKWDETKGRFMVVSETGGERLNTALEPMTLEDFYKEFAVSSPYLVRSEARGGAGSSQGQGGNANGKLQPEQIFGKDGDSRLANKLALQDIKEYQRLKVLAKESGLLK